MAEPVTAQQVAEVYERIRPTIRHTPIVEIDHDGVELTVKLEMVQHAGSFKARGALAQVLELEPGRPVVAASGGNFGIAVAWAAQARGHTATVFVPEVSAPAKRDRITDFGADVVVTGAVYAEAQAAADRFAVEHGGALLHPYEPAAMIAGGGTCALELEAQASELDAVVVAVGGGGLMAGVCAWYGERTTLVAVETHGTAALHSALAAGEPVDVEVSGIAADALGATRIGTRPFAGLRRHVDHSVLVSDDDVQDARRWLWQELRIVAEPAGATALAGLLAGAWRPPAGSRVGVLICGANTDPGSIPVT